MQTASNVYFNGIFDNLIFIFIFFIFFFKHLTMYISTVAHCFNDEDAIYELTRKEKNIYRC